MAFCANLLPRLDFPEGQGEDTHPVLEEAANRVCLLLRLLRLHTAEWLEVKMVWKLTSTLAEWQALKEMDATCKQPGRPTVSTSFQQSRRRHWVCNAAKLAYRRFHLVF